MKYNFSDSFLRVLLILLFMRFAGMRAYIAILFFSSIFNAMLSVRRLLKVADVQHIGLLKSAVMPAFFALLAANATQFLLKSISLSGIPLVLLQTAVCAGFYAALLFPFLKLCTYHTDKKQTVKT